MAWPFMSFNRGNRAGEFDPDIEFAKRKANEVAWEAGLAPAYDASGQETPAYDSPTAGPRTLAAGPSRTMMQTGDANRNGVPDVMERTVTIKERFQPAAGAVFAGSKMSGEAMGARRMMLGDDIQASANAPGLTREERGRRRLMASEGAERSAVRAEQGRQFDSGLRSQERVADTMGRWKFMGDVGAAAMGSGELKPLSLGGGAALLPGPGGAWTRSDAPKTTGPVGLRRTDVDGVYFFTDEEGKTTVQDLRERQGSGTFDFGRYMKMNEEDPRAARDYLLGAGVWAPKGTGTQGATSGVGGAASTGATAPAMPEPIPVKTKEEIEKLPRGTLVIFNGKRYVKP